MPSSFSALTRCGVQSYRLGISSGVCRSGAVILSERGVGLAINTDIGCGESGRESGRIRRGR